jgi:adenylate cyclase
MVVSTLAIGARLLSDLIRDREERSLLRNAFAGHVSPQTLRAILAGRLQPDADGSQEWVTILFADIRGFTKRSETSPPEQTIDLLNRYFAAISGVIHRRGGAVDKFIGDGVMATFGMPQPLPMAERNALEAAQDMLVEVRRLNEALVKQGLAPIEIGIGVHAGMVHAGYIGSRRRREFTVIGDAVNTASRLEGLTKSLGYPIVCSEAVACVVGPRPEMADLGEQAIAGRSPMRLYGWRPAVLSAPPVFGLEGLPRD